MTDLNPLEHKVRTALTEHAAARFPQDAPPGFLAANYQASDRRRWLLPVLAVAAVTVVLIAVVVATLLPIGTSARSANPAASQPTPTQSAASNEPAQSQPEPPPPSVNPTAQAEQSFPEAADVPQVKIVPLTKAETALIKSSHAGQSFVIPGFGAILRIGKPSSFVPHFAYLTPGPLGSKPQVLHIEATNAIIDCSTAFLVRVGYAYDVRCVVIPQRLGAGTISMHVSELGTTGSSSGSVPFTVK